MIIGMYKGYWIGLPTSGGKAGKGRNKTTSVQLFKGDLIFKKIRVKTPIGRLQALQIAKEAVDKMENNEARKAFTEGIEGA